MKTLRKNYTISGSEQIDVLKIDIVLGLKVLDSRRDEAMYQFD